jgi:hypothetical protein
MRCMRVAQLLVHAFLIRELRLLCSCLLPLLVDSIASYVIQQFNVVTYLYCFAEWKKHKLCSAGLPQLPFAISWAMVKQGVLAKRFGWSS